MNSDVGDADSLAHDGDAGAANCYCHVAVSVVVAQHSCHYCCSFTYQQSRTCAGLVLDLCHRCRCRRKRFSLPIGIFYPMPRRVLMDIVRRTYVDACVCVSQNLFLFRLMFLCIDLDLRP